jgi:hypothetical protein
VVTGFGAWLDPRHPEHQRRRKIFQSKLDQAISRSAPTVVYDVNAYQRIHGAGSPDQAVRVSPAFPFSQRSDLGVLVADRCQRAKLSAAGVPFDASSDTSRIDFVRWYPNGLHPLTQSSVTQAIVEALANPDASFWRLRQCRPLSQTLALTPAQLIAVARSWLTLVALDLVDADRGRVWLGSTATTIPSDAQALAGTVRTPADASEWLAVALKSLPARIVRYTTDSSALDWYVDLVAFGGYGAQNAGQQEDLVAINGVGSPEVADADVDVQALRRWILDAELVTSQRSPKPERAGLRTGAPDERVHALREWLVSWHDQLDEWVSGATEDPLAYYVTHPLPPESELFPYFKAAAAQLIAFVERVGEEGPARGVVRGVKLG